MKKLTTLFLLLTLIACGPAAITTPTVTPVPSSTPAPMATSTSAPTATSTPIAGAPIERCVEILPDFPEGNVPSGILVVNFYNEGLSLLNFREQTQRLISGTLDGIGTSPDGKWLTYTDFVTPNDKAIFVESPNGQKKIQFPFHKGGYDYWNPWLGNEWLSYLTLDKNLGFQTVALNPFTGEQQVLSPDYPDFIRYYNGRGDLPLYFGSSNVLYDPSLRFVIYPKDKKTDDGLYAALWDRETNQEIAKVLTGGLMDWPPPIWFSDGRAFVVVAYLKKDTAREWFMVSLDGKVRQLTHIGDQYASYNFSGISSLSPDGHYLAFNLSYEVDLNAERGNELFILDLVTSEIYNTCIPTFQDFAPVWSPDSQHLAMLHSDSDELSYDERHFSVFVLNIEAGWAVDIFAGEKGFRNPEGWLASGE